MPYTVNKDGKGGFVVVKKTTGEVVARPKTMAGAKGYMYHANLAEHKPTKGLPRYK